MTPLRIGKASRYGLYALVRMARRPHERVTARDVAAEHGVSEHHVAKVLRTLRTAGLVEGARGAGGGYQLARTPAAITMLEVVESLDGQSAGVRRGIFRQDAGHEASAGPEARVVHAVLHEIDANAYFTLKSVTIATLATEAMPVRHGRRRATAPLVTRDPSRRQQGSAARSSMPP